MIISAQGLDFRTLNAQIQSAADVTVCDCLGQRFIGTAQEDGMITVYGTPGNALGAYLNGAAIHVFGNGQDAVGDTMNGGEIVIYGNVGDALGYAMRGGCIYVRNSAGYRAGIHMKEYQDKKPVLVIGGSAGSFLGEYLAGGIIIVLGLEADGLPVGDFIGTGMHGGRIFVRTEEPLLNLPEQVTASVASAGELEEITPFVVRFAALFDAGVAQIMQSRFYVLKPNAKNPYKQLYAAN